MLGTARITKFKNSAVIRVGEQTQKVVGKIVGLRNDRGDISHGKVYPKDFESSPALANSIAAISDGICSFMIEEMAVLYAKKIRENQKLIFDDLTEFNTWIDEKHQVTTLKIDYSKILYEFAYDKYEELFYGDYLEREELVEYTAEWSDPVFVVDSNPVHSDTFEDTLSFGNFFDPEDFWSYDRFLILQRQAGEMEVNPDKLMEILNEMYFTEKPPLRDTVADAMYQKPPLLERSRVIAEKIKNIESLATQLFDIP
jgi:hypothetical protein